MRQKRILTQRIGTRRERRGIVIPKAGKPVAMLVPCGKKTLGM
ncbi:hypothetical protein [Leptospirillum ferriphilum]|nr:hypothetical protein [Leptospirillum ferriphilum]